jgi:hypothetical protein
MNVTFSGTKSKGRGNPKSESKPASGWWPLGHQSKRRGPPRPKWQLITQRVTASGALQPRHFGLNFSNPVLLRLHDDRPRKESRNTPPSPRAVDDIAAFSRQTRPFGAEQRVCVDVDPVEVGRAVSIQLKVTASSVAVRVRSAPNRSVNASSPYSARQSRMHACPGYTEAAFHPEMSHAGVSRPTRAERNLLSIERE